MPPRYLDRPAANEQDANTVLALPYGVTATAIVEAVKALFMTVWCPDSRSVESNCGIPRG